MTSQGHVLELTILSGRGAGRRVMVQAPGEAILGRSSTTDLQLLDDRVSRRHCQILIDERGAAFVQDLGSGNGTRLDEQRVSGRRPLRDGQTIGVGDNQILVTLRRGDVAVERRRRHQTERIGPQRQAADATPTWRERAVDPFSAPAPAKPPPPAEAALDPFAQAVPPTKGVARRPQEADDPLDPFDSAPLNCSSCQAPTPRSAALERGGRFLCERCAPRVEVEGIQVARQPSAEGEHSTIYQGRELAGGAWVSVEVLRLRGEPLPEDLERLRAFTRELSGLEHPGLPRLLRYVEEPGQRALVWSQLAGEPLSQRLERHGPSSWQVALPLLRRVAAAGAAAHWAGVPHGELRAERVLVSERGVQVRWPLPARSVEGGAHLPQPDLPRLGSLPPELIEDVRVRDRRADVYEFGALCVQVLAGRSLFPGDSVRSVLAAVTDPVRMPQLGSLRGLAPQPMIELIRRAVAKEPAMRPASLVEVLRALQLFA